MTFLERIVWEADVGPDHARPLKWEPDASQKRSIAVRLPERRRAPAETSQSPTPRAKAKRQCAVPKGSIKKQMDGGAPEA